MRSEFNNKLSDDEAAPPAGGSFPASSPAERTAANSFDEESPPPSSPSARRCDPTKRWALVCWLVAAALAIAVVVTLVTSFATKPQSRSNATSSDPQMPQMQTQMPDTSDIEVSLEQGIRDELEATDATEAPSKGPTKPPTSHIPTYRPTKSPRESQIATTAINSDSSKYTIGVYYYPWHGKNFHGGRYLRGELEPPQFPALGEYDDTQPAVIGQHLQWSREANINLWVSSWWGPNRREDNTLKDVIMKHPDLPGTKIAVFYETTSRIKDTTENVFSDVAYIANTYFDDPNYLRIDDRPVLFVYLSRVLSRRGILGNVTTLMRDAAFGNGGHDLYIMGDQVFGDAPRDGISYEPFDLLDGVTNYDIYGNMGRPNGYAGIEVVNELHSRNKLWRDASRVHGHCDFVPAVSPGYNDRAVRDGHPPLSRKLDEGAPEGSLFETSLESALTLVEDSADRMLMITSWNEWHEDTQIEPVVDAGSTDQPLNLTCYGDTCDTGLNYDAYGMLYLYILREATSKTSR